MTIYLLKRDWADKEFVDEFKRLVRGQMNYFGGGHPAPVQFLTLHLLPKGGKSRIPAFNRRAPGHDTVLALQAKPRKHFEFLGMLAHEHLHNWYLYTMKSDLGPWFMEGLRARANGYRRTLNSPFDFASFDALRLLRIYDSIYDRASCVEIQTVRYPTMSDAIAQRHAHFLLDSGVGATLISRSLLRNSTPSILNGYKPMRMIATLRISIAALVLGALALSGTHAAEPKPISIVSANLKRGLTRSDIAQIKLHVEYWVAELAGAQTVQAAYKAREGFLADYNKYATSIRYQVEFARSAAAAVPPAVEKLNRNDQLISLKEINFAIVVSEMAQLTTIPALDALVRHENPGVRFLAWRGYRGVRDQAIRKGKDDAKTLFAALRRHAATEPSPIVAAAIVDVLDIEKSALTAEAFKKAFDLNFNTLVGMLKTCCDRLAVGEGDWARSSIAALPILQSADGFYKPDRKKAALIVQQMVNIAQAAAMAYDAAEGQGRVAFQCAPLLRQVEPAIGSLSADSGNEIRKTLLDKKKSSIEKSKAIRRAVLDWIDRLESLGVRKPVFTPIKAPAATTQPATRPAT